MSSFWKIFEIQMSIFRRVRWEHKTTPAERVERMQDNNIVSASIGMKDLIDQEIWLEVNRESSPEWEYTGHDLRVHTVMTIRWSEVRGQWHARWYRGQADLTESCDSGEWGRELSLAQWLQLSVDPFWSVASEHHANRRSSELSPWTLCRIILVYRLCDVCALGVIVPAHSDIWTVWRQTWCQCEGLGGMAGGVSSSSSVGGGGGGGCKQSHGQSVHGRANILTTTKSRVILPEWRRGTGSVQVWRGA